MFPTIYSLKVKIKTILFYTKRKTNSNLKDHYRDFFLCWFFFFAVVDIEKKVEELKSITYSVQRTGNFPNYKEISAAKFNRGKIVAIYFFKVLL